MKLAFKVLLLIVLIVIGKMEKQNQLISKPRTSLYNPVYSQNTVIGENTKAIEANDIQRISVKYNNHY